MLSIRNLSVTFQTPEGEPLPALGPVSIQMTPGEFVCLVGPSGCGKSTMIKVIAGLQPATSGGVFLNDVPIVKPSPKIGLMFQDATLMPWRTVRDNIGLPLELAGVERIQRDNIVDGMLDMLGLTEFASTYPVGLSGGMAQRVALGRVLSHRPDVLLLDEPFGALDALTREQVSFDLLRAWRRDHQTILMVTHDITEAVVMADRVLVMGRRPGQIIEDITVSMRRPRHPEDAFSTDFGEIARSVRAAINRA
ncbi:MAG: ABC transporter ATP-binding protein [Anaerolineae bacterium]|nr:ABC transporter ATP-binding protein [Anaerolineae bacterium]